LLIASSALGAKRKTKLDEEARAVVARRHETRDKRMEWWRNAKFGMFVHWGVYSVPAGTYKGKQIKGIGEWIMYSAKIPVAEYKEFARRFNPQRYNAEEWVQVMKDAGMKYVVITSKHHDGFAMYHSDVSEWDIDEASPEFKRDPIDELAKACRKHGIRLGLYYSHCWDWTHPGGAKGRNLGGEWDDAQKGDNKEYFSKIALPQIAEILTRFKPDVIWFDTPIGPVDVNETVKLLALQPDVICNGRLSFTNGDLDVGEDYAVHERSVPSSRMERDWEACATTNSSWGYKSYDTKWKAPERLIRDLVKCAGGNGNYLLNVGPTEEGIIPEGSVKVLRAIGKWLEKNGDSIYDTRGGPFDPITLTWGSCTQKKRKLYLHIVNRPAGGSVDLPGLKTRINKVYSFGDSSKTCPVTRRHESAYVNVSGIEPDPVDTILVAELAGDPEIVPVPTRASEDGAITLIPRHVSFGGGWVKASHDRVHIWKQPAIWLKWLVEVEKAGKYEVLMDYVANKTQADTPFEITIGGQMLTGRLVDTRSGSNHKELSVGTVDISRTGRMNLTFKPGREIGKEHFRQPMIGIWSITLKPAR
jgi:alpha-L-fucosidase